MSDLSEIGLRPFKVVFEGWMTVGWGADADDATDDARRVWRECFDGDPPPVLKVEPIPGQAGVDW